MAQKRSEPNSSELHDSSDVNVRLFKHIYKQVKKVNFIKEIETFGGITKPLSKHYQVIAIQKLTELNVGFRYTDSSIYIYNGAYWEMINNDKFKSFLGKIVVKMGINKFDGVHYRYRNELYNQFISVAYEDTPEDNKDIVGINLQNGTLEINNGKYKLKPFNRDDFFTYQLSFAYDKKATAPIFKKYLDRVLPDEKVQAVLSEYLGYVFIRNGSSGIKIEKFLSLSGGGSNGKSVLFEVLNALLGNENIEHYSLEELTDSTGYSRAEIGNKLLNYSSETTSKVNEAILKQIASGEPVSARSPYGKPFSLNQYAKIICNFNKPLTSVEHTHAFFRRFLNIPFEVTIPEEEQDRELHHKIINAELPGVMNWILEGLTRLLENKQFTYSEAVEKSLEKFKLESNSVALFLDDGNYYVCECETGSKELYGKYIAFCIQDGYRKVSQIVFNRRLKQLVLEGKKVEVWKASSGKVTNVSNDERQYKDLNGNSMSEAETKAKLEELGLPF